MIITKVGVTRDDATLAALFDRMSALTQRVRAVGPPPGFGCLDAKP